MDYKKMIIEMVEEEQNTGKLRFVYMILENKNVRGRGMDYKERIIALLEKVKTEQTLNRVYKLLEYLYLREE